MRRRMLNEHFELLKRNTQAGRTPREILAYFKKNFGDIPFSYQDIRNFRARIRLDSDSNTQGRRAIDHSKIDPRMYTDEANDNGHDDNDDDDDDDENEDENENEVEKEDNDDNDDNDDNETTKAKRRQGHRLSRPSSTAFRKDKSTTEWLM